MTAFAVVNRIHNELFHQRVCNGWRKLFAQVDVCLFICACVFCAIFR